MAMTDSAAASIQYHQQHLIDEHKQDYGKFGRIAEALARAQGEIRNPARNAENPHFKSKYANLADGIIAIREALSKHGIAYVQTTRVDGGVLYLTTALIHAVSGDSIESEWPVGAFEKLTPQQMGSALTYARRYSLFGMVGISGADDDDDGNAASEKRGGNGSMSADRYRQDWEVFVTNSSDPAAIRGRWSQEATMRRDLFTAEQTKALLGLVTERLKTLEGKPQ
jgi:hypothetical protein